MAGFPERWMQELLQATDIAAVISEYVALREKGGRLWGLCPFHNEKTASFSVTPEKQLYYCFGCHSGGSVIHFIMELEKLSYVDTIKLLAEKARMPLPEETNDEELAKERALKEKCHEACREAALFYHRSLASPAAQNVRAYLEKRGVDANTVRLFGLGCAGNGDALTAHLLDKGFTREVMTAAGLALERNGGLRDVFWGRLMFPIIGMGKKVVGFGGRVLGDGQPKYLNTAENIVFNKRRNLYGLNFFRKSGHSDILLVEGYMDVVSLHQFGITNAVASLGTALTKQQAHLIKRNVPRAYIAYDSDSAGQNAALKAARELMDEGVDVRVMRFPEGSDPDEFIRKEGLGAFEQAKENALAFAQFRLSMLVKDYDLADENARELYAKAACTYIRTLEPLSRERYYTQVSRETGYSLEALTSQAAVGDAGYANIQGNNENSFSIIRNTRIARFRDENPERSRTERVLLCILVFNKDCALRFKASHSIEIFGNKAYEAFARACISWHESNSAEIGSSLAALLDTLEPEQAKLVSGALDGEMPENSDQVMADCVLRLTCLGLRERMAALQKSREQASDKDEQARLAKEYMELNARLRELERR